MQKISLLVWCVLLCALSATAIRVRGGAQARHGLKAHLNSRLAKVLSRDILERMTTTGPDGSFVPLQLASVGPSCASKLPEVPSLAVPNCGGDQRIMPCADGQDPIQCQYQQQQQASPCAGMSYREARVRREEAAKEQQRVRAAMMKECLTRQVEDHEQQLRLIEQVADQIRARFLDLLSQKRLVSLQLHSDKQVIGDFQARDRLEMARLEAEQALLRQQELQREEGQEQVAKRLKMEIFSQHTAAQKSLQVELEKREKLRKEEAKEGKQKFQEQQGKLETATKKMTELKDQEQKELEDLRKQAAGEKEATEHEQSIKAKLKSLEAQVADQEKSLSDMQKAQAKAAADAEAADKEAEKQHEETTKAIAATVSATMPSANNPAGSPAYLNSLSNSAVQPLSPMALHNSMSPLAGLGANPAGVGITDLTNTVSAVPAYASSLLSSPMIGAYPYPNALTNPYLAGSAFGAARFPGGGLPGAYPGMRPFAGGPNPFIAGRRRLNIPDPRRPRYIPSRQSAIHDMTSDEPHIVDKLAPADGKSIAREATYEKPVEAETDDSSSGEDISSSEESSASSSAPSFREILHSSPESVTEKHIEAVAEQLAEGQANAIADRVLAQ